MIKVIRGFPPVGWYYPITSLWLNELQDFEKGEYPGFTHMLGAEVIYWHRGALVCDELRVVADNVEELKQFVKENNVIERLENIIKELSVLDIPT